MKPSVAHPRLFVAIFLFVDFTLSGRSSLQADDLNVSGNAVVSGEIDVYGNTFNFGSWATSSGTFGLGITYSEDTNHASTLTLTTTRPVSGWLWQRTPSSGTINLPQMRLSSGNALILYDQSTPTPVAKIVLDPIGTSSFGTSTTFNGANNLMPSQTVTGNTSVLTVGLADARYRVVNSGTSLAIGVGASSTGNDSVAIGHQANAASPGSTAFGESSFANSNGASAFGNYAQATQTYTTSVGFASQATGYFSTVTGVAAIASGEYATSIGMSSQASGAYSTALGHMATASNYFSTALGKEANASGFGSTALGFSAQATGYYSSATAVWSKATGYLASSLGTSSIADGYEATALGIVSGAGGSNASALGFNSSATGGYATALGSFSSASGAYSTALTSSSVASGDYSVSASRGSATSVYEMAVGAYGLPGGNAHNWVATDALFTVGNGQTAAAPSNAFSVKKNGDATVSHNLTVSNNVVVNGAIIVQPQGDLSMGEFTATPSPTP